MSKIVLIFLAVRACEGYGCYNKIVESLAPGVEFGCGAEPSYWTKFSNLKFTASEIYKLGGDSTTSWNLHVECDGRKYKMYPNHCAKTDDYGSASRAWDGSDSDENGNGVFVCKDKFRFDWHNDGSRCGFSNDNVRIRDFELDWQQSQVAANSTEIEAMEQMMPVSSESLKDEGNLTDKLPKSKKISKEEVKMSDDASHKVSGTAQSYCTVTAAGQRTIYVPNCKGTGCNAQGPDCAFCVYDMSACAQAFGYSACQATYNARAAQGIYGCDHKEQTPNPKLNATSVLV